LENDHMSNTELEEAIETAWIDRDSISPNTKGNTRDAIEQTLNALDSGSLRVAERKSTGEWCVNQWAKKSCFIRFSTSRYGRTKWWPARFELVG